MKRYMIFVYYHHDSIGGMNDYWGSVDTIEEAKDILETAYRDFSEVGHILDTQTGELTFRSGVSRTIKL